MIGVAVHWEVAAPRADHSRCDDQVREVDAYHRSKGYSAIAYNMLACTHGGIFTGRGWGVPSAANGTRWSNLNFFAICAMTGPGQPHTPELKAALDGLAAEALRRSTPPDEVSPHSRFFNTACPGDTIRGWIVAGLGHGGSSNPIQEGAPMLIEQVDDGTYITLPYGERQSASDVAHYKSRGARVNTDLVKLAGSKKNVDLRCAAERIKLSKTLGIGTTPTGGVGGLTEERVRELVDELSIDTDELKAAIANASITL